MRKVIICAEKLRINNYNAIMLYVELCQQGVEEFCKKYILKGYKHERKI